MSDETDKTVVKFEDCDGAIIFKKDGREEQYIIPTTDDSWANNVREAIAFFIYATQRPDWILEFQESLGSILNQELELKASEKKKDRSHLRVIK